LFAEQSEESFHVCDAEIAELPSPDVLEKLSQAVSSGCDGSRRESPFNLHIPAESIDLSLMWSRGAI